ncbi:MAG TPA: formate dehydrogenase subunit delta [Dongiaceae bacterium]
MIAPDYHIIGFSNSNLSRVAISAPTTLALRLAAEAGLLLIALARYGQSDRGLFPHRPKDEAVPATLNHVAVLRERRMRRQMLAHLSAHRGEGLNEIALAAVQKLAELEAAKGDLSASA